MTMFIRRLAGQSACEMTFSAPEQSDTSVLGVLLQPRHPLHNLSKSNAEHVGFIHLDVRRSENKRSHTDIATRFLRDRNGIADDHFHADTEFPSSEENVFPFRSWRIRETRDNAARPHPP